MREFFRINQTQILKFEDNEFKIINKEDNGLKVTSKNNNLKSDNERIAGYVTRSIKKFNKKYKILENDREFILVFTDRDSSNNYDWTKSKIELFQYDFDNNKQFDCFAIEFIDLTKCIVNYLLKLKEEDISRVYKQGNLSFTFNYCPDSKTKLVRLEHKGDKLVEFTEYMDFGIKVIKYIHPIFSSWNIRLEPYPYRLSILLSIINKEIRMDAVAFDCISILEDYIVNIDKYRLYPNITPAME